MLIESLSIRNPIRKKGEQRMKMKKKGSRKSMEKKRTKDKCHRINFDWNWYCAIERIHVFCFSFHLIWFSIDLSTHHRNAYQINDEPFNRFYMLLLSMNFTKLKKKWEEFVQSHEIIRHAHLNWLDSLYPFIECIAGSIWYFIRFLTPGSRMSIID